MFHPLRVVLPALCLASFLACGGREDSEPASAGSGAGQQPAPAPEPEAPPRSSAPSDLPQAIVLSLAQFVQQEGKPVPGPARMEFVYRQDGQWKVAAHEDPDSNVFHKVMVYPTSAGARLLSMGGTRAIVKLWEPKDGELVGTTVWEEDFGGKWSRMRDAEIADLDGDGQREIAVATHDQGVVAVLRPQPDGSFAVERLDAEPETFVHEIEVGDLDADGVLEVYATPSEPNRLDGTPQSGEVVRYVPAGDGWERTVVADLGGRHAKEILVEDVDGDGRDELYVSVEGHSENKQLVDPVEIRRYEADTPADAGAVIGTLDDRLSRFLTAGDVDGDGRKELVAAAFKSGVWLFRPGEDPNAEWEAELVDRESGGFEHASILTDLDGDGKDELYVASDDDKELRRYVWVDGEPERETIYVRPDDRPIFTWNLMPVPVGLVPEP